MVQLIGGTVLDTDRANMAEVCDYHVRQAADRYRERIADRWQRAAAYAESLAYLRRKTQWGAVIASAALDAALADVPQLRDQPNTL